MKKILAVLAVLVATLGFAQSASDILTRIGGAVVGTQGGASAILERLEKNALIGSELAAKIRALLPNGEMSVDLFTVFSADVLNGKQNTPTLQAAKEILATKGITITSVNASVISQVLNPSSISQSAGSSNQPATPKK